jgi:hypothetical protein
MKAHASTQTYADEMSDGLAAVHDMIAQLAVPAQSATGRGSGARHAAAKILDGSGSPDFGTSPAAARATATAIMSRLRQAEDELLAAITYAAGVHLPTVPPSATAFDEGFDAPDDDEEGMAGPRGDDGAIDDSVAVPRSARLPRRSDIDASDALDTRWNGRPQRGGAARAQRGRFFALTASVFSRLRTGVAALLAVAASTSSTLPLDAVHPSPGRRAHDTAATSPAAAAMLSLKAAASPERAPGGALRGEDGESTLPDHHRPAQRHSEASLRQHGGTTPSRALMAQRLLSTRHGSTAALPAQPAGDASSQPRDLSTVPTPAAAAARRAPQHAALGGGDSGGYASARAQRYAQQYAHLL